MLVIGCILMLSTIIVYHVLILTHFGLLKPGAMAAIDSLNNFEFPSADNRFAVESVVNYKLSLVSIPSYAADISDKATAESQHLGSVPVREIKKLSDRITNELSNLETSKMSAYALYFVAKTDLFASSNWTTASAIWNKFMLFNNSEFTRVVRRFNGTHFIHEADRLMAIDMLMKGIATSSMTDATVVSLTEDTLKKLTDSTAAMLSNATDLQLYTYLVAGGLDKIGAT